MTNQVKVSAVGSPLASQLLLITGAVILTVAVSALFLRSSSDAGETGFRTAVVKKEHLSLSILATGVVQPENRVGVESPISGRAEKILVQNGDHVVKGQTLMWMSSIERAALLDAARSIGPQEVAKWEEFYNPMSIVAPITGTVILRNIEPGQTFTYSHQLFIIADRLVVQAQVDETDIAQVKKNQATKIVLDAYPDEPITGLVEEIAFDAKTVNNVTTYSVTVLPSAVPAHMRSGMTANVTFAIDARPDALVIPAEAVKTKNDQLTVLVQNPKADHAPIERAIKTGLSDGKRLEVLSGLSEGDVILIPRPQIAKDSPATHLSPLSNDERSN
jgi:macrolide-specific efflux system membrane fusion protein